MKIYGEIAKVRETVKAWKAQGLTVGFVPTMGYLHEGHKSLIDAARKENDRVVVSIFVNPMQFGPKEDLASYPRDLDKDAKLCEAAGVDVIFHPEPEEMYTPQFCSYVDMNGLTTELCGKTRPTHFRGVQTVVLKLFHFDILLQIHVINNRGSTPQWLIAEIYRSHCLKASKTVMVYNLKNFCLINVINRLCLFIMVNKN